MDSRAVAEMAFSHSTEPDPPACGQSSPIKDRFKSKVHLHPFEKAGSLSWSALERTIFELSCKPKGPKSASERPDIPES
jgi:hypothetical protein